LTLARAEELVAFEAGERPGRDLALAQLDEERPREGGSRKHSLVDMAGRETGREGQTQY
jgi:hypothetical protein